MSNSLLSFNPTFNCNRITGISNTVDDCLMEWWIIEQQFPLTTPQEWRLRTFNAEFERHGSLYQLIAQKGQLRRLKAIRHMVKRIAFPQENQNLRRRLFN